MATHDPEFYQAPKFTPEPPPTIPKQHGCFFYGCIIASVLAVLMALLVAISGYFIFRALNQLVDQYTSTTPRDLPKVDMPEELRQKLNDRVEGFRKAVESGAPTEPLVLTSDDLNALIADNPDLKGLIYVKVEGDEVKGQVSLPLERWLPMMRGRYLNGEADLKASLSDGVLIVTLDGIEVNGQKAPEEFMKGMRQQNLAKDVYKEKKAAEMIRKLESLEIKDGKIILKVRAGGEAKTKSSPVTKELPVEVVAPAPDGEPKGEPAKKAQPSPDPGPTPKNKA